MVREAMDMEGEGVGSGFTRHLRCELPGKLINEPSLVGELHLVGVVVSDWRCGQHERHPTFGGAAAEQVRDPCLESAVADIRGEGAVVLLAHAIARPDHSNDLPVFCIDL